MSSTLLKRLNYTRVKWYVQRYLGGHVFKGEVDERSGRRPDAQLRLPANRKNDIVQREYHVPQQQQTATTTTTTAMPAPWC